jgi:hypothetical protein
MEEAPENCKESSHSAHASGIECVVNLVRDYYGLPCSGVLQISFCFTNFAFYLYLIKANSNSVELNIIKTMTVKVMVIIQ